jgi:hypothetical protein
MNLSINPELRLPFDGSVMRSRLSVSTRRFPAIGGFGIYGITFFAAIEAEPTQGINIECALDGGLVTGVSFLGATGVATITMGIYFQLTARVAKLTGYFRATGCFDVYGLITLNLEFYLGFTYTSDGKAEGECSITVEIGYAFCTVSVTATAHRELAGSSASGRLRAAGPHLLAANEDGPPEPARPITISEIEDDWGEYCEQFFSWADKRCCVA